MSKIQPARKTARKSGSTMQHTRRWVLWLFPVLFLLIAIGIIFSIMPNRKSTATGPRFQKQGELTFISAAGRPLQTIDIEIADTDLARAQGLMWRRAMEENQGMLFLMETEEPQSFWMLNTYIPLDILFVNAQREIVTIRDNTQPQSLGAVTSDAPALYVVEVNAGFCVRHGIQLGDRIEFVRQEK